MKLTKKQRDFIDSQVGDLDARHGRAYIKILLAGIVALIFSIWLTAKGLFDKAVEAGVADFEGMLTAAASAIVAATLIGGGTLLLFGAAMSAPRKLRGPIVALAICLMPFTLGISTTYAVLGNAGAPSLIYQMRDKALEYEAHYSASATDSSGAQSAKAALLPLESLICALVDGERESGLLTGSAGSGTVSAAYFSVCESVQTIIETLAETAQRTDERRDLARQILAELVAIPDDTGLSVFERQANFRNKTGALEKLIEESAAEKVADRLRAQLNIIASSIAALGVKGGEFGARQDRAVQNLKTNVELVSGAVEDLLAVDARVSVEPPGPLLPMDAAVLVYWQRNIPQILIAIAVDFMTLWFVGLLMVTRTTARTRREELVEEATKERRPPALPSPTTNSTNGDDR